MKVFQIFTLAAGMALLGSCGESTEAVVSNEPETPAVPTVTSVQYMLDLDQSNIEWAGSKLGGGGHNGTINFKKGYCTIENGVITSGTFHVDMASIANSDLEDEEEKAKLIGHLSSPDFFDVAQFPMATFTITKHAEGQIAGNLQLKDAERAINFPVTMRESDGILKASGEVTIDRTQWGVNYGSSALADAFLDDNMTLNINLYGTAKAN